MRKHLIPGCGVGLRLSLGGAGAAKKDNTVPMSKAGMKGLDKHRYHLDNDNYSMRWSRFFYIVIMWKLIVRCHDDLKSYDTSVEGVTPKISRCIQLGLLNPTFLFPGPPLWCTWLPVCPKCAWCMDPSLTAMSPRASRPSLCLSPRALWLSPKASRPSFPIEFLGVRKMYPHWV